MTKAGMAAGVLAGTTAGRAVGQNLSYDFHNGYSAPGEMLCSAGLGLVGGIACAAIGGLAGGAVDAIAAKFHFHF